MARRLFNVVWPESGRTDERVEFFQHAYLDGAWMHPHLRLTIEVMRGLNFKLTEVFMELENFKAGDRIQMHPVTDRWMRGDKFAEVVRVGRKLLLVKFDKSGHVVNVNPKNVMEVL